MSKIELLYEELGQALWLDYIDRNLVTRGGLEELVAEGLRGVTSNPTIFHQAITGGTDYDDAIRDLIQADPAMDAETLYQWLVIQDVQEAADILRPIYDVSGGADGFVSLEVSPHLAYDADGTIAAARHLWQAVDRPNLMIKVPATVPGLPAVETLLGQGINVNVTLLFSLARYEAVADVFRRGVAASPRPGRLASVASFFVSRIDTKVDAVLDEMGGAQARALRGRIGMATAKVVYRRFRDTLAGEAGEDLARLGARPQRPLWASTGTKDPAYGDVRYVEGLMGTHTVTTVPPATLDAFLDHGEPRPSLETAVGRALQDLEILGELGVDLAAITQQLEQEGVKKFAASHDAVLAALDGKRLGAAADYVAGRWAKAQDFLGSQR